MTSYSTNRLSTAERRLAAQRNRFRTCICLTWIFLLAVGKSLSAEPSDAHLKSPMIHLSEVKSQRVAFHLMIPEQSPQVLKAVLLHAAHFNARDNGRWYRFCAEHGLAHMTLTEFPSGRRRPERIGKGISIALKQFAEQLNRPELEYIPVLSTGFSAGGMGDPAMRKNLPERYLGCANMDGEAKRIGLSGSWDSRALHHRSDTR